VNRFALTGLFAAAAIIPLEAALADGMPNTRPRPRVMQQEEVAPPPVSPAAQPRPPAPYTPPPPGISPWYVNLSAGALFPQNTSLTAGPFTGNISYGTGFHGFVGLGYQFNPWLAGELEVGYLRMPIDSISLGGATATIDGRIHGLGFFANAVLSMPDWQVIRPYIAGGPGFVHRFGSDFTATGGGVTVNGDIGSSTDFAVQAKAGIDLRLSERFSVAPEYRYMWVNTSGNGLGNTNIHAVGASFKIRF
jgi:opacity protein-like surface antigen